MAELAQDFRIALRQLGRAPGFAATAILTLALGIGANTAIFSALNATLLKMLPVRDPQELYTVRLINGGTQPPNTSGTGHGNTSFSYPVFQALRQNTNVLADVMAHIPLGYGKVPVRLGDMPTEKAGEEVSGNYFSGLGVPMALGRGLNDAEEREHSPVTVISYRFWQEAFARDPQALGKTLYIKGDRLHDRRRHSALVLWSELQRGNGFLDSPANPSGTECLGRACNRQCAARIAEMVGYSNAGAAASRHSSGSGATHLTTHVLAGSDRGYRQVGSQALAGPSRL